jgi:hypothetical protein
MDQDKSGIHGFGIRLVLCIMGLMSIFLTLIGHAYIRNRKFIPLSFPGQIQYLISIKWTIYLQIILKIVVMRASLQIAKTAELCSSGSHVMIELVLACAILAILSKMLNVIRLNGGSTEGIEKLSTILIVILWILFMACIYTEFCPYLSQYASIALSFILMMQVSNYFINELRINYVIGVFVVIIFGQLEEKSTNGLSYYCYLGSIFILLPTSVIIPWILRKNSKQV